MRRNTNVSIILRRKGYHTAAFHSNPYLSKFFHYDRGFDFFWDSMRAHTPTQRYRLDTILSGLIPNLPSKLLSRFLEKTINLSILVGPPIAGAKEITNKAISWLKKNRSGVFLWIHYMDVHHPRIPPKDYVNELCSCGVWPFKMAKVYKKLRDNKVLSSIEQGVLTDFYDASIKYVDENINRLLNELDLSDTIIILTADHGDLLGEHSFYGHGKLYEEVVSVPLIISGPGIAQGIKVETMVSHMDIAPTILKLLGKGDFKGFKGRSLTHEIDGIKRNRRIIISVALNGRQKIRRISIRDEGWKYIRTEKLGTNKVICHELYNLRTDPRETVNLYKDEHEKVSEFESKLLDFIREKGTRIERRIIKNKIQWLKRIEKI